jgi:alkyl hydroperoxide reductase subunit F
MSSKNHVYDLIIIGAGPAGITAAVYAARQKLDFLIISENLGGQTLWSSDVSNYTGFRYVSGADLVKNFEKHLKAYDIKVKENEKILSLEKKDGLIEVVSGKQAYSSKAVIVASGKRSRPLNVPGETEFMNKGVFYCATCDGPLFSGKDVAVIGGGNSALDAAMQLVKIARKIYIINDRSQIVGDSIMKENISNSGNVEVFNDCQVKKIEGKVFVDQIVIDQKGQEKKIAVTGIFIEIGLLPNSDFANILDKNEIGEIKIDQYNRTNIPGIFAAGDVTVVPEKQIIIAAGEGSKALLGALKYMASTR